MKGHYLSGKGKMIAVVTTLCVGVGFTAVPLASAYPIPVGAGLPGGQPTKPQGGSKTSRRLDKDRGGLAGRLHRAGTGAANAVGQLQLPLGGLGFVLCQRR